MAAAALAPERWKQLRPLLDRALDLDEAAREAFLRELSSESEDLRRDLERLIARHLDSAGLSRPAAAMAQVEVTQPDASPGGRADPWIGRRIGPYQLTRMLGAGGMGAVYEGQRVDGGFRQIVALKLVGGIHPGLTARFARERQILAELRHPHIAQLLDGGETPEGMPYFALEFIDGRPITEYADATGADTETRLRLLIEVAEALAYAHRRNVIHRDIKPNNILVSADGHVKLLDFGIAKLLKGESGPTLTQQRMGPMTPEYAAPEQFRGGELSAATDVYQFGVLLFRLLAGRLPYRANADDGLAWARAVSEQEPQTLSAAMREAQRERRVGAGASGEITLKRFAGRRAGELDTIVRRCLAKSPAARYPGMDALIADLQAWLVPAAQRPLGWKRPAALALLAVVAGASLPSLLPLVSREDPRVGADAAADLAGWDQEPALVAMGLRPENLHTEHAATIPLIRRAILAEARGDAPAALALLASAHRADRRTPVPALLSAYWTSALAGGAEQDYWRTEMRARVTGLADPYIDLLANFVERDANDEVEPSLRYSGAILEMHPEAWFLHLARAHQLNRRGLREAAVRELQAIQVERLGHRKLVDAIADRASMGDLPGAWAQFQRLARAPDDPERASLRARLTYTAGDLPGARDAYLETVRLARSAARFDIEARGLLWAGVFSGALGDYAQADGLLQQARTRLAERSQFAYAADAALALAQIAALAGDRERIARELDSARALFANLQNPLAALPADLYAARLTGAPLALPESLDDPDDASLIPLILARQALQAGDREAARAALERARSAGIEDNVFVEEAALLARELDAPGFALKPIDPPFGPYSRYAARWALGAGASIAPARVELPR